MRPGPDLDVLSGTTRWDLRVESWRGHRKIADVPCWNVKLDWSELAKADGSPKAPAKLTLNAPREWAPKGYYDALSCYGQTLWPYVIITDFNGGRWEVPMGGFRIIDSVGDPENTAVEARDMLLNFEENPLPWAHSPWPGETAFNFLRRMEITGWPVRVNKNWATRLINANMQLPTDRLASVIQVADSIGCDLTMDYDGVIDMYPRARWDNPTNVTYSQAGGMLVSAVRTMSPGGRLANRYYVTAEGERVEIEDKSTSKDRNAKWVDPRAKQQDGIAPRTLRSGDQDIPIWVEDNSRFRNEIIWDKDKKSFHHRYTVLRDYNQAPYDWAYGKVTNIRNKQTTDDRGFLNMWGDWDQAYSRARSPKWTVTIAFDPRIEIGDIVRFEPNPGTWVVMSVTSYSMDLSNGGSTMTMDGRELRRWG